MRPDTAIDPAALIDSYTMAFDPADRANGSLYLCTPPGAADNGAVDTLIEHLRGAGLWSTVAAKTVVNAHRASYKDELKFVAAAAFTLHSDHGDEGQVVLVRFDHPRYPSDPERWDAWLACAASVGRG